MITTVHTNTALGVIGRLVDMGVEPYLLHATLIGSLSQRLVRRIDSTTHSYQGRLGLFEYLEIPFSDIDWDHAEQYMFTSLQDSAHLAINSGITTLEEVHRAGILL